MSLTNRYDKGEHTMDETYDVMEAFKHLRAKHQKAARRTPDQFRMDVWDKLSVESRLEANYEMAEMKLS